jgi:hypothetical protein
MASSRVRGFSFGSVLIFALLGGQVEKRTGARLRLQRAIPNGDQVKTSAGISLIWRPSCPRSVKMLIRTGAKDWRASTSGRELSVVMVTCHPCAPSGVYSFRAGCGPVDMGAGGGGRPRGHLFHRFMRESERASVFLCRKQMDTATPRTLLDERRRAAACFRCSSTGMDRTPDWTGHRTMKNFVCTTVGCLAGLPPARPHILRRSLYLERSLGGIALLALTGKCGLQLTDPRFERPDGIGTGRGGGGQAQLFEIPALPLGPAHCPVADWWTTQAAASYVLSMTKHFKNACSHSVNDRMSDARRKLRERNRPQPPRGRPCAAAAAARV